MRPKLRPPAKRCAAAVRLHVDSWRWAGAPVVIRTGKTLPVTATEVHIRFRRPPHDVFGQEPSSMVNTLRLRVYPDVQAGLSFVGKKPGAAGWTLRKEDLAFAEHPKSEIRTYERLIGAALSGQRWLFAGQDTIESCWRIVDPVLGDVVPLHRYARGSWVPRKLTACCQKEFPGTTPPSHTTFLLNGGMR